MEQPLSHRRPPTRGRSTGFNFVSSIFVSSEGLEQQMWKWTREINICVFSVPQVFLPLRPPGAAHEEAHLRWPPCRQLWGMILVGCPDLLGDQRGRCVPGAPTGAPPRSRRWKKHEATTQAIICTILSASNTSLWRRLSRGFLQRRAGEFKKTGNNLGWSRWEETLLYGVRRFFPGGLWDSCGGGRRASDDSVFACAHGDWVPVTGCLWLALMEQMELALWNANEWVNDLEGAMLCCFFAGLGGDILLSLWMQAGKKIRFCLCPLSLRAAEASRGSI